MIKRRQFMMASSMALTLPSAPRAAVSSARWSGAAPLPINTQELYPTVHKGRLYVAGGIARRLNAPYFTNRVFSFDPIDNQWRDEPDLPEDMHHAALVSTGERLFLIGGFNGGYTHIWRMRANAYELIGEHWEPAVDLPSPQAEGVLGFNQGHVHIVTGQSPKGESNSKRDHHTEIASHWVWTPDSKNWESAAPIPLARNSATGGWVDNQLIVAGGRHAQGNYNATHIYDKREDRWREASPIPLPQAGTAGIAVDDGIIVFGGEIFVPTSAVYKEVWRYSLSLDKWTAYPDMITPRHGIGAGRFGNKVFVVGGATNPGGSGTTNMNEVLEI